MPGIRGTQVDSTPDDLSLLRICQVRLTSSRPIWIIRYSSGCCSLTSWPVEFNSSAKWLRHHKFTLGTQIGRLVGYADLDSTKPVSLFRRISSLTLGLAQAPADQAGFVRPVRPGSAHACKSWSSSHRGVPVTPEWFESHTRPQEGASQTSAAANEVE